MTRGPLVLLLAAALSSPAVLRWLRDDLAGEDVLLRFGLAAGLAAAAVHLMTAVVSSYRPVPVEATEASRPAEFEDRRAASDANVITGRS